MAKVAILTEDARLYRLLSLLVSELGAEADSSSPSLVITDKSDLPPRFASLPVLLIGDGGMPRPFSHADMKARILELLSNAPTPLFTPTEERLYRALKEASPAFVSRDELIRTVFGDGDDGGRLNLYIYYLRKKIETDGKKRIFAVRGKGYSLLC